MYSELVYALNFSRSMLLTMKLQKLTAHDSHSHDQFLKSTLKNLHRNYNAMKFQIYHTLQFKFLIPN